MTYPTPKSLLGHLKSTLLQAAMGVALLGASASYAASYHIEVNTAGLGLSPSAPFSLDFQFNDGGVLNNNTATVSNFNFFGGSAGGSPTLISGATGDIAAVVPSVTFNNSGAFQELFQGFTPGTKLSFDVAMTTNLDGATPDAFVFAILDNGLANIPTNGLGNSLVLVEINSTLPAVQTFAGTGEFASVTAVPEPETFAMLLAGLGLVGAVVRRKQRLAA